MHEGALPAGPWLAYLGDDFTGSTDVMEAFAAAGVPTVLFLKPPSPAWVTRFAHMRCIGLAGTARSQTPAWMRAELPAQFASLAAFGAPLLQYKVCSTFDSSPERGSIGQAIELGVAQVGGRWSPMVVGAPRLRRYQAFGQLFAAMGHQVHRLDRHPTMAQHPVTPMDEADLRRHLARQTPRRSELIDLVQLQSASADQALQAMAGEDTPVVLIDVVDEHSLAEAGRLVWQGRGRGLFSASSSGLDYALVAHWRRQGWLDAAAALLPVAPTAQVLALSGSCSPATAAQIAWARAHGWATERLDLAALLDEGRRAGEVERVAACACAALAQGRSPLVFSAEGPSDPAVTGFADLASSAGLSPHQAAQRIGEGLAASLQAVLARLPAQRPLRRLAVAGGDSSGAVLGALDIAALTVCADLVPGAPLCRVWSDAPQLDGVELVLKGGQMGGEDFFGRVLHGTEAGVGPAAGAGQAAAAPNP